MKTLRSSSVVLRFEVLVMVFGSIAEADEVIKKTVHTLDGQFQLPRMTLLEITTSFIVIAILSDLIVHDFDNGETQHLALFLTIPDYRLYTSGMRSVTLFENCGRRAVNSEGMVLSRRTDRSGTWTSRVTCCISHRGRECRCSVNPLKSGRGDHETG
jgi:hypothetical protein